MRIAAIDIGSNSIHMVIADAARPPAFEVVDREREVVQIGRGSFADRRLRRGAMRRTAIALRRFVQLARRMQADRILCTATAAVRESANGGEFLQMCREQAGVTPRVIPAAEEGRLIDLAIRSALRMPPETALVVDIGGGSAQLAFGDGTATPRVIGMPLGALRLTEEYLSGDPPAPRELSKLRRAIRQELRAAFERAGYDRALAVYGSSGSIHALAHAAAWLEHGDRIRQVNGYVLTAAALRRTTRRLLRMTVAQRERLPEIDAPRAEIILPGALVLLEVLERAQADHVTVSDFGVREGLVTDWLQHHVREVSASEQVEDLRLRSVLDMIAKFGFSGPHNEHVADLSLAMFDGLRSEHGLGDTEREWLRFAALLHDVGSSIGYDGHAEHSYYVIQHGNLRGLSEDEIAIIANVARYHGKRRPRKRDSEFARLRKRARRTVRWLSAILRIAEGLDRSHYQLIESLRILKREHTVSIVVHAVRDAQLELWAAARRVTPLEELLGADVRIVTGARSDVRADARVKVQPRVSRPSDASERARPANGTPPPPRAASTPPGRPRPGAGRRDPDDASPRRPSRETSAGPEAPRDRGSRPAPAAARGPNPHRH
jgi:exopolyphosphatase/guanosine-5'-triphosphate,3'-diphosphate pyrophosphatase